MSSTRFFPTLQNTVAQKTAAANAEVTKRLVEANKRLATIDADVAKQRDSGRKALAAAVQNTVSAVEKAKVRTVVQMGGSSASLLSNFSVVSSLLRRLMLRSASQSCGALLTRRRLSLASRPRRASGALLLQARNVSPTLQKPPRLMLRRQKRARTRSLLACTRSSLSWRPLTQQRRRRARALRRDSLRSVRSLSGSSTASTRSSRTPCSKSRRLGRLRSTRLTRGLSLTLPR